MSQSLDPDNMIPLSKPRDYSIGVDIKKLDRLTVADAIEYIKSCLNGHKITIKVCDTGSFNESSYQINQIRLLVDNPTGSPVQNARRG